MLHLFNIVVVWQIDYDFTPNVYMIHARGVFQSLHSLLVLAILHLLLLIFSYL